MHHVLLLLQSDVDNSVGDFLSNTVKELGLTDDHSQVRVEVDLILNSLLTNVDKNVLFEIEDGVR